MARGNPIMSQHQKDLRRALKCSPSGITRSPWRHRSKVAKLLPADLARIKEKRAAARSAFTISLTAALECVDREAERLHAEHPNHSKDYYLQQIMQTGNCVQLKRKPNRWNAFQRQMLKEINDELPPGAPRYKITNPVVRTRIMGEWNKLDHKSRDEATEASLKELIEFRDNKGTTHNSNVSAQRDATRTLATLQKEIDALATRTGVEVILLSVRGNVTQNHHPFSYVTSDRVEDFFKMSYKTSLPDMLAQLEAYCISGLSGLAKHSAIGTVALKSEVAELISQKLGEVTQGRCTRMVYGSFAKITEQYGVVIKNWPLPDFKPPGQFNTRAEVTVLMNAWQSDSTRFEILGKTEHEAWLKERNISRASGGDQGQEDGQRVADSTAGQKRSHTAVVTTSTGDVIEPVAKKRKKRVSKKAQETAGPSATGTTSAPAPPPASPSSPPTTNAATSLSSGAATTPPSSGAAAPGVVAPPPSAGVVPPSPSAGAAAPPPFASAAATPPSAGAVPPSPSAGAAAPPPIAGAVPPSPSAGVAAPPPFAGAVVFPPFGSAVPPPLSAGAGHAMTWPPTQAIPMTSQAPFVFFPQPPSASGRPETYFMSSNGGQSVPAAAPSQSLHAPVPGIFTDVPPPSLPPPSPFVHPLLSTGGLS